MVVRKMEEVEKGNEEKYLERMNYFPFTHGDAIENQRAEINEIQR